MNYIQSALLLAAAFMLWRIFIDSTGRLPPDSDRAPNWKNFRGL